MSWTLDTLRRMLGAAHPEPPNGFVYACELSEVKAGQPRVVSVGEHEIALFRRGGEIFALDAKCPHSMGPLEEGRVVGQSVICPWHGWEFSMRTGVSPNGCRVPTFEVIVREGVVFIARRPRADYRDFPTPRALSERRS